MAISDAPAAYPIRMTLVRPERQRRLTNFPLLIGTAIRLILATPSYVMLELIASAAFVAYFFATFVITFRGRYPRGLFKLLVGTQRWQVNLLAYVMHLFDPYPPMDLDQRPDRELQFQVDYPTKPSRWLNAPFLGIFIKMFLTIPHLLIISALYFLTSVVVFIAEFAILFTGRFPPGLYDLVAGYLRWSQRVYGYLLGFTDRYPPFSFE